MRKKKNTANGIEKLLISGTAVMTAPWKLGENAITRSVYLGSENVREEGDLNF